jgi:hypothetical protein
MTNTCDDCSICLVNLGFNTDDELFTTKCNHKFHNECWDQFKSHNTGDLNCPLCRTNQNPAPQNSTQAYNNFVAMFGDDLVEMFGPPIHQPNQRRILGDDGVVRLTITW